LQSIHKHSSDASVFIKHGELTKNFSIKLDFIRDLNNKLGLISEKLQGERFEKISNDTLDQICKFHNLSRSEIKNDFNLDKRYKVQDVSINL
jgi:hypothetical protein